MKVFYDPSWHVDLSEFGIGIPLLKDRFQTCFDYLKQKNFSSAWHFQGDLEDIHQEDLLRVHDATYIQNLFSSSQKSDLEIMRAYEQTSSHEKLRNVLPFHLKQVQATYTAANLSLTEKYCYVLGGGHHHAMKTHGSGFCLLNDIVITLRKLQNEKKIKTAWVIDVDAHKGDGTAALTYEDKSISTLSIHMQHGWPLKNPDISLPSTLDIPIAEGDEEFYLPKLQEGLEILWQIHPHPDLVIIVDGSDPYEKDTLESAILLKLSKEDLLKRDLLIYNFLKEKNIPQTYVTAGGYGPYVWEIHAQFLEKILA